MISENNKIFNFCTGILQARIPTGKTTIPCCARMSESMQFGFQTSCPPFKNEEKRNLTIFINEEYRKNHSTKFVHFILRKTSRQNI